MVTWKRNNDVGIGGIDEIGLSVPSPFVHKTAEEQQIGCPKHHDWSEKIEKVHGRSLQSSGENPCETDLWMLSLFAQHMEGGEMISCLL
jgi:hypothetical protein